MTTLNKTATQHSIAIIVSTVCFGYLFHWLGWDISAKELGILAFGGIYATWITCWSLKGKYPIGRITKLEEQNTKLVKELREAEKNFSAQCKIINELEKELGK